MYCVNCKKAHQCYIEARLVGPKHQGETRFPYLYFCVAGYHGAIVDPYIDRNCPHYRERSKKDYVNKFGL